MKGTRHSEEQVIAILKQGEAGLSTAELWALVKKVVFGQLAFHFKKSNVGS